MVLSYSVSEPIKSHVYCYGYFIFDVPLMMLFAAAFCIAPGVGGCWWTISDRAVLVDVALWDFSNNPPNYASVADTMTFLIVMHSKCTGPFSRGISCIGVFYFGHRGKCLPALLRASGYDM